MFKIANAKFERGSPYECPPDNSGFVAHDACRFGISEDWTGNLNNGLLHLGEFARNTHGLDTPEIGLLTMMRCYDPADRAHILRLFEQAATEPSRFCYSTTIIVACNQRQPVFCIGESSGLEDNGGNIVGLFIFPRFQLPTAASVKPA